MKASGGLMVAVVLGLWQTVQGTNGCEGEATPTPPPPTPTPEVTPQTSPTPDPAIVPRPASSLGQLSLLRVESHGHPYYRDAANEIVYDGGAALNSATQANNMGVVLASVKSDTFDEAAQGDAMLAVADSYPQIVPLLWCSPGHGGSASVAEQYLDEYQFAGLKFHPTLDNLPADSPLMDPYLEVAARYHVPVVIHTAADDPARPARVEALAARHPDVPIVLFHAGLGTDQQEALGVARRCSNCLLETSWVPTPTIFTLVESLGSERVIFGADATVDGAPHYENAWGSGVGNGSYDAQLTALGLELPRDQWRSLLVNNTITLFHLVTVHSYQPTAKQVALRFDQGRGLGRAWPMVSEGGGWWRRAVPSYGAVGLKVVVDGQEKPWKLTSSAWEVYEQEGKEVAAPALTTVRIHYNAGYGHGIFLRGEGWPLSWTAGEPTTWTTGNVWTVSLAGVTRSLSFKVLLDDATWEQGNNHTLTPGQTLDITPVF